MRFAAFRLRLTRQPRWERRAAERVRRGDMTGAFACAARAARRGDGAAQLAVAVNYLEGRGVPSSAEAAILWLQRAAKGGQAEAMAHLAKLALGEGRPEGPAAALFGGRATASPLAEAFAWAERSAAAGASQGKVILAALLSDGPPERRDRTAARALLREAAGECASACLSLALLLARDAPSDPAEITGLLEQAASADVPVALYLLGIAREFCFGCQEDLASAAASYRRAAELGLAVAQTRIGCALLDGRGVRQDMLAGETWLRKAALSGQATAAARLGALYARSDGPPNFVEAGLWFSRAGELGHATAARIVGFLHLTGTGLHEDRQEAARWFRRADRLAQAGDGADIAGLLVPGHRDASGHIDVRIWFEQPAASGDPLAAYRLAVCFAIGLGGDRDDQRAAGWLSRAAHEHKAARLLYGQLLLRGRGVAKNEEAGRHWIEQAAEDGLPEARVAFAELLANGRGGVRDTQAALRLFAEESARGDVGATYALGALHGGGHGMKPDKGLASRYFLQAANGGHPRAQLMVGRYLRDGLAGERDVASAYDWFAKARQNGCLEAQADLEAFPSLTARRSSLVIPTGLCPP